MHPGASPRGFPDCRPLHNAEMARQSRTGDPLGHRPPIAAVPATGEPRSSRWRCPLLLARKPRSSSSGTLRASSTDRVSLAAAGCAFYATLALFPAISMLISVYGLAFNSVGRAAVAGAARPAAGAGLRPDRRAGAHAGRQPSGTLSIGLVISFVLTLLERRDRHQIGALGAERRLRRDRAARHPAVPARSPWHDAVCRCWPHRWPSRCWCSCRR